VPTTPLSRLLETVKRPSHDRRPSIEVFPDLDVNRVAADLQLERFGKERGGRGEPLTSSATLDEVEARIVERVEQEKKRAHGILEDELQTYADRLSALDFEGRFSAIEQAAQACVGTFKAEVAKGRDDLHGARRDLKDLEEERNTFKADNGLRRSARVQEGAIYFVKISIIFTLLVVETLANSVFLAKGNEQGLVGGFVEALSFSAINIGSAIVLAVFGARNLNHRNYFRKLFGLLSIPIYAGIALALNLALAHYRDITATFIDGGAQLVLEKLSNDPLGLGDIRSAILLFLGVLFSLIAFIDALFLFDPYPGYGHLEQRLRKARADYSRKKEYAIDTLIDVRDSYDDALKEIYSDLADRRAEHDSILAARARLVHLFDQHQNHLERTGGVLLTTYREANVSARTTKPPKRYTMPFQLERISIPANPPTGWESETLQARIHEIQQVLSDNIKGVHREFDTAIDHYRQLDDLIPETHNGAPQA
jgi:hypothetical protein